MIKTERNTNFILIINKEGKFNYSNKGFQNSPHYIAMATAKYRAKDLVFMQTRFFDPKTQWKIEQAEDLLRIRVRYYQIDDRAQMLLNPDKPEMSLREFADAEGLPDVVAQIDALSKILSNIA